MCSTNTDRVLLPCTAGPESSGAAAALYVHAHFKLCRLLSHADQEWLVVFTGKIVIIG